MAVNFLESFRCLLRILSQIYRVFIKSRKMRILFEQLQIIKLTFGVLLNLYKKNFFIVVIEFRPQRGVRAVNCKIYQNFLRIFLDQ